MILERTREKITVTEASRRYTLAEKTVRNWIHNGWLPAKKVLISGHPAYEIDPFLLEHVMRARNIPLTHEKTRREEECAWKTGIEERLLALENHLSALLPVPAQEIPETDERRVREGERAPIDPE